MLPPQHNDFFLFNPIKRAACGGVAFLVGFFNL